MPHITTCTRCGHAFEESSEETANAPVRLCPPCFEISPDVIASLPVTFDPQETNAYDRWAQFLCETIQDETAIGQLQEFFGYCLTRDSRYQKALLVLGPAASGKSLLLQILKEMVGEYNCSSVPLNKFDNAFFRASLEHKLINFCPEDHDSPRKSDCDAMGYIKSIIAGEQIDAAVMFGERFTFRPFCKIVFPLNQSPSFFAYPSIIHRLLIVLLRRQFLSDADPDLINTLKKEIPGIFWWSIKGLHRLRVQKGFTCHT